MKLLPTETPKKSKIMTICALVDFDSIVYRAGFAAQRDVHTVIYNDGWSEFKTSSKVELKAFIKSFGCESEYVIESETELDPLAFAISNAKNILKRIFKATECDEYELFLSDDTTPTFREDLATIQPYKGNRWSKARRKKERKLGRWTEWLDATEHRAEPKGRPIYYNELRSWAVKAHGARIVEPGIEADDALGMEQALNVEYSIDFIKRHDMHQIEDKTKIGLTNLNTITNTIICSIDKDLDMIPGWHYNYVNEEKYWMSQEATIKFFYTQVLTGDTADNIRGVPGIGPKKAEKILEGAATAAELKKAAFEIYAKNSIQKEWAETCELLWILREPLQQEKRKAL